MSDPVSLYFYYPLRDRLPVDLYRDVLAKEFPQASITPLIDKLIDDHPLPHFRLDCPANHIEQLVQFLESEPPVGISIRIELNPVTWIGRKLR